MEEAQLEETGSGLQPVSKGWFVLNVCDARWGRNAAFGAACAFEGPWPDAWFSELGIKLTVLQPGQPNCLYHRESQQEAFLVLAGECLLLVEGEERPLRTWDFVHCPPNTDHVFVGAGDGPCAILMVGTRSPDKTIHYPVSEVASRHGASVPESTNSPREAYADYPRGVPTRFPWPPR